MEEYLGPRTTGDRRQEKRKRGKEGVPTYCPFLIPPNIFPGPQQPEQNYSRCSPDTTTPSTQLYTLNKIYLEIVGSSEWADDGGMGRVKIDVTGNRSESYLVSRPKRTGGRGEMGQGGYWGGETKKIKKKKKHKRKIQRQNQLSGCIQVNCTCLQRTEKDASVTSRVARTILKRRYFSHQSFYFYLAAGLCVIPAVWSPIYPVDEFEPCPGSPRYHHRKG